MTGTTLVLLSGGIDSATALSLAASAENQTQGLFIHYGQAAARREKLAAAAIAQHFGVDLRLARYSAKGFGAGEIRGRNAFLLHSALLSFPTLTGTVIIGTHAGTPYVDCSSEFVEIMQRSYDLHTGGSVGIAAPFAELSKIDIYKIALKTAVPIPKTYSCESANRPCGECLSCKDREVLLARS